MRETIRIFVRIVVAISFIAAVGFGVITVLEANRLGAGSPPQIYPACEGPGSCHAFGFGVEYTVRGHADWYDERMALISSGLNGEEHVEIWSPIPDLVRLPVGTSFRLENRPTWTESFRIVRQPEGRSDYYTPNP